MTDQVASGGASEAELAAWRAPVLAAEAQARTKPSPNPHPHPHPHPTPCARRGGAARRGQGVG